MAEKPRVLLVADVPNWIFDRHCRRLTEMLGDEFEFETTYGDRPVDESRFDLLYPLEWGLARDLQAPRERAVKTVTGIRSHISWNTLDLFQVTQVLCNRFQRVHVVSRRLEKLLAPFVPGLTYLTHGLDTRFFQATRPCGSSTDKLRVGWAGNRKSPAKGFEQYVAPLGRLPGVELVFCGYSDKNLDERGMREFYDSIDVYVCSSSTEGNNNSLLEAASMERAIITTDTGTVPEYLQDGVSARIVEREVAAFVAAVLELRRDPQRRQAMGRTAREAVVGGGWDWKVKAEEHRIFLREAVERARQGAAAATKSRFEALLNDAQTLFRSGKSAEACDVLRSAVMMRPHDAQLALFHAQLLVVAGRAPDALTELQRAEQVAPGNAIVASESAKLRARLSA